MSICSEHQQPDPNCERCGCSVYDLYTDAAAFRLLERIAEKSVEPFVETDRAEKTVGQWRREVSALLNEAVWFVAARRRAGDLHKQLSS